MTDSPVPKRKIGRELYKKKLESWVMLLKRRKEIKKRKALKKEKIRRSRSQKIRGFRGRKGDDRGGFYWENEQRSENRMSHEVLWDEVLWEVLRVNNLLGRNL